jgi:prepilin-type N-terminal cleavage/methylation domain-containing protein
MKNKGLLSSWAQVRRNAQSGLKGQAGFTLVEMAIVLVIIGLILGAVIKGQELILSAKAKKAVGDINAVVVSFNNYGDMYGNRIPGDDGPLATLTARGGLWGNVTRFGNNNGSLDVTIGNTFVAAGEGAAFWQHLWAAALPAGNIPNTAYTGAGAPNGMAKNAFGGLFGVTSDNTVMGGLTGNKVCMSRVPGKIAAIMDSNLDDGRPNSGLFRASDGSATADTAPAATASTAYIETNYYTVCYKM